MATSDGLDGCLQRGRSQSDPNILTEPGIELAHGTGKIGVILSTFIRSICEFLFIFYFIFLRLPLLWCCRPPCLLSGMSEH